MVLTPDQKKRIAALDTKPAEAEEDGDGQVESSRHLRSAWLSLRILLAQPIFLKFLIVCAVCGIGLFFVFEYQLQTINFRNVFSSGPGTPVSRLSNEIRRQKQKAEILRNANTLFLEGEYKDAFEAGMTAVEIDENDPRARELIDRTADATTQKAERQFDSGEIEAALKEVRLALKYRPQHGAANELLLNIATRLLHEAKLHYNKKEYPQVITKTKEVQRIVNDILKLEAGNISDSALLMETNIESSNLLSQTSSELLTLADELFFARRYSDALEMVSLSMRINPRHPHALSLMKKISTYVETPELRVRGFITLGSRIFAQIQLPDNGRVTLVKKGDTLQNVKVIGVDADKKEVRLQQIHTKQEFVIKQPVTD